MADMTQANFTFHDFRTAGGEVLPEVTLAYVTRGTLAADGRNAILVTHGYTSGPRMIEPGVASSEGAWSTLGRSRRTDRYGSVLRHLFEHAGLQLRLDQRRLDRSAHRKAIRVQFSAHHGRGHRDRAKAHAGRAWRDASAGGGRSVLWRVPGVPVGRDVSRISWTGSFRS